MTIDWGAEPDEQTAWSVSRPTLPWRMIDVHWTSYPDGRHRGRHMCPDCNAVIRIDSGFEQRFDSDRIVYRVSEEPLLDNPKHVRHIWPDLEMDLTEAMKVAGELCRGGRIFDPMLGFMPVDWHTRAIEEVPA